MNELLEGAELLALRPEDTLIVKLADHRISLQQIHEVAARLRAHLPDRKVLVVTDQLEVHVQPGDGDVREESQD